MYEVESSLRVWDCGEGDLEPLNRYESSTQTSTHFWATDTNKIL